MAYTIDIHNSSNVSKIETRAVLKKLTSTRAALAELKGVAATIPNENILIDTLSLQEAKDSSAIENIVTTHDEVYQHIEGQRNFNSANAKEVHRYAAALKKGFALVKDKGAISINSILSLQELIEGNSAGIRSVPGTVLKNDKTDHVVYTPPQDKKQIQLLLQELEKFIHADDDMDPLVRMALIHHHFESIHPFYDGNGRTGRVINILFLIKEGLLDLPVLYLSRYIITHRARYYELLQTTRDSIDWEPWILYMLDAVEVTSQQTVTTIKSIKKLMTSQKQLIRSEDPKIYSQDLLNNIFRHPYTKVDLLQRELHVTAPTARRYLDKLTEIGALHKLKYGRSNYYINMELLALLKRPFNKI